MNKINSDEIKYFLTVAECLNFTEAANRLFVSQPAITKWIKHLEKELNLELFKRNSKSVSLTPAGEYLYKEWSLLSSRFQNSLSHAYKLSNPESEAIHIGVIYGLDYDNYLAGKIHQFRTLCPDVSTHIHIYNFYEMKAKAADMDFILSSNLEEDYLPACQHIVINKMDVSVAMAKNNPLAIKEELYMEDLKEQTFFCVSEQTRSKCIHDLKKAFEKINALPIIQTTDNIQSCLMAVQMNQGVSIIDDNFFITYDNVILKKCINYSSDVCRVLIYNHNSRSDAAMKLLELLP